MDRSFVRDLEQDLDDQAIASTIVLMGHNLRFNLLAQGYYFSRPVPVEQMAALFVNSPL